MSGSTEQMKGIKGDYDLILNLIQSNLGATLMNDSRADFDELCNNRAGVSYKPQCSGVM